MPKCKTAVSFTNPESEKCRKSIKGSWCQSQRAVFHSQIWSIDPRLNVSTNCQKLTIKGFLLTSPIPLKIAKRKEKFLQQLDEN